MKKLFITLLLFAPVLVSAQLDNTLIVVNLNDNPTLQYKGSAVKMKGTVLNYAFNATKDFIAIIQVTFYMNNSGAYGSRVTDDILLTGTLSSDQQSQLLDVYKDRIVTYSTVGQFSDVSGNIVTSTTPGAIPEIQYWQQSFKVNQVPGFVSASATGALELQYLIVKAIIAKLDTRKKW